MNIASSLRLFGLGLLLAGLAVSLNVESKVGAEPTDHQASAVVTQFVDLFNGRDLSGWVNVNTGPDTWKVKDGLPVCSGKPIGVMRSEKQYENFILHIEWRHMKAGGNSGVFVWSEGVVPEGRRLPKGMEVQMLELEWVNLHRKKNGEPQDIRKGYLCLESEGSEIHSRNIRILELPGGITATEQTAKVIN